MFFASKWTLYNETNGLFCLSLSDWWPQMTLAGIFKVWSSHDWFAFEANCFDFVLEYAPGDFSLRINKNATASIKHFIISCALLTVKVRKSCKRQTSLCSSEASGTGVCSLIFQLCHVTQTVIKQLALCKFGTSSDKKKKKSGKRGDNFFISKLNTLWLRHHKFSNWALMIYVPLRLYQHVCRWCLNHLTAFITQRNKLLLLRLSPLRRKVQIMSMLSEQPCPKSPI